MQLLGDKAEVDKRVESIREACKIIFPEFDGKIDKVESIVVGMIESNVTPLVATFMLFVGFLAEENFFGDEVRVAVMADGINGIFSEQGWEKVVDWFLKNDDAVQEQDAIIGWTAEVMLAEWKEYNNDVQPAGRYYH